MKQWYGGYNSDMILSLTSILAADLEDYPEEITIIKFSIDMTSKISSSIPE